MKRLLRGYLRLDRILGMVSLAVFGLLALGIAGSLIFQSRKPENIVIGVVLAILGCWAEFVVFRTVMRKGENLRDLIGTYECPSCHLEVKVYDNGQRTQDITCARCGKHFEVQVYE